MNDALRIARKHHLNIIPLRPRDKRPVGSWKDAQEKHYNTQELKKHFEEGGNLGFVCGPVSGPDGLSLVVLDFDNREAFEKLTGSIPETLVIETSEKAPGWRGKQIYLFTKGKIKTIPIKDRNGRELISIRGAGAYVVAPRSTHPKGLKYEVALDLPIKEVPLEFFEELRLKVYEAFNLEQRGNIDIRRLLEGVEEGGRDNALVKLLHFLRRSGEGKESALKKIFEWNRRNRPPIDHNLIYQKAEYHYGLSEPYTYRYEQAPEEWQVKEDLKLKRKEGARRVLVSRGFMPRPYTQDIIDRYEGHIFYEYGADRLWGYNPKTGIWEDVEPEIIKTLREGLLGEEQIKTHFVNEVLADIKGLTYKIERPQEPHWRYVCVKNGVFDLKEGVLLPHSPRWFFLNQIPYDIDEEIQECPTIDRLFDEWVGAGHKNKLYEMAAYCLIREYPYQKLFFLYGPGNNGKGTYGRLIKNFIGEINVSGVGLDSLIEDRFASAGLFKKLINISGEVNVAHLKKTDLLKRLTGGDLITAEEKFKPPFTFTNYAKMIFLTNVIPITPDKTIGFYRRFYPVEFAQSFEGKDDPFVVENLPQEEYRGLLYKCLFEILPRLYQRSFKFTDDRTAAELEEIYESLSNPLHTFVKEYTAEDVDEAIPRWVFREVFGMYLRQRGLRGWNDKEIGEEMKNLGWVAKKPTFTKEQINAYYELIGKPERVEEGKQWYAYTGVKIIQGIKDIQGISFSPYVYKTNPKTLDMLDTLDIGSGNTKEAIPQKDRLIKILGVIQLLKTQYGTAKTDEIKKKLGDSFHVSLDADLQLLKKDGLIYEPKPGEWGAA